MASCDLCGKPASTRARIEGAIMSVCASCSSFGSSLAPPRPADKVSAPRTVLSGHASFGLRSSHGLREHESEFVLAGDFHQRLRQARQRMKLTEEEAALKLQISKNDLLHYESGKRQPIESMTTKLEKFYGVSLKITV